MISMGTQSYFFSPSVALQGNESTGTPYYHLSKDPSNTKKGDVQEDNPFNIGVNKSLFLTRSAHYSSAAAAAINSDLWGENNI